MRQVVDQAIVLSRVDYAERDRILTMLARESGKISVLAKSVRAQKSRLAGGTELLSTSDITFIDGKSDLKPLTGARLHTHFGSITSDMQRMQQAFDALKLINKLSEIGGGQEYFDVLVRVLETLNDSTYDPRLIDIWFGVQLLSRAGTMPNIKPDTDARSFMYDHSKQEFTADPAGVYSLNDLKLIKLSATQSKPLKLQAPSGSEDQLQALIKLLLKSNLTEV